MASEPIPELLRGLEAAADEERWTALAFLAGQSVRLGEHELKGALRRAELLLAAGGDPRRPLELDGRGVTALARDLDAPEARAALAAGLRALEPATAGLPAARSALRQLLGDGELAWRCFACALLASRLGEA